MPKVSVIVPVYNVEKYIDKCLNSLVNQTLDDIEIIVVNDGSKDESEKIIKKYKKEYNNIIYVTKENGGLSSARNFGMIYATGEYVAFLDSDDYVDYELYEKMYKKAKEKNYDYVECDFYWEYEDHKKADVGYRFKNKKEMFAKARVVAWNKLIKRDIIINHKLEFPVGLYYEDVEFFYKLIIHINTFAFVKQPLIYYVQRESSIVNKQDKRTKQIFKVLDNVIKYYKEKGLYEEYKEEIEYTYSRLLLCSSLKRILKIKDKITKELLVKETWQKLNNKFPNWKKNKILKSNNSINGIYMKSMNNFTFKIYTKLLSFIFSIKK